MNKKKSLLKRLRLKKGWTQEYVSDLVGIGRSTLAHLESEGGRKPKYDVAIKLADLYGVDARKLFK